MPDFAKNDAFKQLDWDGASSEMLAAWAMALADELDSLAAPSFRKSSKRLRQLSTSTSQESLLRKLGPYYAGLLRERLHLQSKFHRIRLVCCATLFVATCVFFILGCTYLGLFSGTMPWIPWTLVVILAGALGGFLSALTRIFAVRLSDTSLRDGFETFDLATGLALNLLLSPVKGAAFGVILYMAFVGGLIQGPLFPKTQFPDKASYPTYEVGPQRENPKQFAVLDYDTFSLGGPADPADVGKLIVWSLVAGYCERLVPDFLRSLSLSKGRRNSGEDLSPRQPKASK